jgi:putative radical SAM enzyme (TIGR03279 family)
MSVLIKDVIKFSPADKKGIKAGDILTKISGHEITDFLDYQFYTKDSKISVVYERDGKTKALWIKKDEDEDLGLTFETYLMDKERHCKNKCIFCFIDQNPKGLRESIYFKDDDSRLSFLFGNYITLTNLSERDVEKIIEMHISPVNVSVHTMNKELRVHMMKNKNAGESLSILHRLSENGIAINTQLVLCPGINDGNELRYSLEKLGELGENLQSIACVPVGVTKHREGLFDMPEYTRETAAEVIDIIDEFGEKFKEKYGTRLVYAADEFYLKSGRALPDGEYYETYCQIENGVGMWTSLKEEFLYEIENCEDADPKNHLSVATGVAAYPLIKELADIFMSKYNKSKIDVYEIKNDFFGHSITVAGLITGKDLVNQLRDKSLAKDLAIPSVMLRSEGDLFLDSVSTQEVEEALGVTLKVNDCTGGSLFSSFMGQ